MSFWPFPKTLLEQLKEGASRGTCVDLGSGQGEFARRLRRIEVHALLVDRELRNLRPGVAGIRADATRLPFASSCTGLFTASNFVRHLGTSDLAAVLAETARCATPGGRQVVVEDSPDARNEAEANYRRILELLTRVDPTRGAACAPGRVESQLAGTGWKRTRGASFDNELRPKDRTLPLRWLRQHTRTPSLLDEVRRLEQDVQKRGLAYGRAWYLVLEREDA